MALALLLTACSGSGETQSEEAAPKSVKVVQPQTARITRYLHQTGTVRALESVDLTARVSGYLKSIGYRDGFEVKAGDPLFLIEPDQYEAQMQQAKAAVEQAEASLDNAQIQLARQEELARSSTTTQANVDNARSSRDEASAQLNSAKASLTEAEINLGYTRILAPFDGFVTAHQADVGALVGSGSPTTLATIVKLDPIHVTFSIPDTDMLQLRKRARARGINPEDLDRITVEAATMVDDGFPYRGKLDYIAPQTDEGTGTLSVRAIFDNKNRDLVPNLFLRLRIPMGEITDAVLVPPTAIGTDQEGRYLLAVNGAGEVERRAVTLLERSDTLQQIKGEVQANDWIVQNVASGIRAGEKVEKKPVSMTSDADAGVKAEGRSQDSATPAAK
ncbi:efflux RND transporter periplasmic adaptor subunit (plasmid) [Aliirhizobium terrae]|uniref:efflux RND transporter periplasmic adaptor subunit n=1 Tax=Terrirhizobium terrae TaxID=2926709 RepID=UPI002578561B|nr:efflux RND transporter periplasmic adaptor subunit [Rhizobium sp. CC-CFT758]WJH37952.1 efflux RND transporter periplasmic adaptor subunit [Rhizobium sp. CC-CFT758]